MTNLVRFEQYELEIITVNSMDYIRGAQIGHTLGLDGGAHAVGKIYKRHKKEFSPDMTLGMEISTAGGPQLVRLYSLRGAALIAMFSDSPKAASFRGYLLDLYERVKTETALTRSEPAPALPAPQQPGNLRALSVPARMILKYRRMGLSTAETARLVQMAASSVKEISASLRAFGLLEMRHG